MSKIVLLAVFLVAGLLPVRSAEDLDLRPFLYELVKHADLIVVATPQTVCGGCLSEGPWPNGVTPTPHYDTFFPELKIDRVLKGTVATGKNLRIAYTALRYGPKDPPKPGDDKKSYSFDVSSATVETGFPGSPHKGTTYVFFLENRLKREPTSDEAFGKEIIVYRNFDRSNGMVPESEAIVSEVTRLIAKP